MSSNIDKIFDFKGKKDIKIQFWILLGPLFLFFSLFLISFAIDQNKDLFLHSIVGLILCWKYKKKGLMASILFLIILIFIKHFQISQSHLWQLGIEFSVALGFIISYLCLYHVTDFINSLEKEKKEAFTKIEQLEKDISKEQEFYKKQYSNFKYEIDRTNLQINEKTTEIHSFKELVEKLRDEIDKKNKEIEEEKNKNEEINIFLFQEKEKTKELEADILKLKNISEEKEFLQLKNINSLYEQLKIQFEEKKNLLDATRKELFYANEKLQKQEIEKNQINLNEHPIIIELQKELSFLIKENEKKEEENIYLQDLVSQLTKDLEK
ncbi:MAG: hypothetical protein AMS24_01010 [Chlamydiae bacterium SM23_39]|nr:MAG: hypothetical protein AMS24_01010 [Chlamydiae bacterium SM23_39]